MFFFRKKKKSPLEENIGYVFKDKKILQTALTHPSYRQKDPTAEHFERLEFLGDAVVYILLAEKLYHFFPEDDEGVLARYRSILGKGSFLAGLARKINLQEYLRLSDAAWKEKNNVLNDNNLADAFEALMGAVFLDSGPDSVTEVFFSLVGDINETLDDLVKFDNPKGKLQEFIQAQSGNNKISYEVIECSGPEHRRKFTVSVLLNERALALGSGSNRKNAEEEAAAKALEKLKIN